MTDLKKPHKWAKEIIAWANGETIQYRKGTGEWCTLPPAATILWSTDLIYEYRVKPKQEPHKWQLEREAFLAGKVVECRSVMDNHNPHAWFRLDAWIEEDARKAGKPVWDRDWLEFRLQEPVSEVHLFANTAGARTVRGNTSRANVRLVFHGKELKMAQVLR